MKGGEIKNLLLRKKARINILERITVMANKEIEIVNEETCKFLWNRKENESFLECILSHAFMILLSLDKVIGFLLYEISNSYEFEKIQERTE
jgi:hypothetical protein